MDISEKKESLRRQLLHKRRALPEDTFYDKSARIIEKLKSLPAFDKSDIVHCYISMNENREVNTRELVRELLESPRKKVMVPVTNFESGTLSHVYLERFSDLRENKWKVLEPVKGEKAEPNDADLVIVPMVGGDPDKNRMGYGKGFYDRFLKQLRCPKVGLLFERCLVDKLPVDSFDVPMDTLVTERRIIS